MFKTLSKIKKITAKTQIFCAHEYTEANYRFCQTLLSNPEVAEALNLNQLEVYGEGLFNKRQKNIPSVPLSLITEMSTSPFLLAKNLMQFTAIRQMRNVF